MGHIGSGRLRTLALQGVATAVTALLIGGAAVAFGQPLGAPLTAATETPTDGVTEDPTEEITEGVTEDPTEEVTEDPTEEVTEDPIEEVTDEATEEDDGENGNAHGKAVSDAARGVTPPVGNCRNHGHWVSTVAKGLASCDDNPRPAKAKVDEPAQRVKSPKAAKADKHTPTAGPSKAKAPKSSKAKSSGSGNGKGKRG